MKQLNILWLLVLLVNCTSNVTVKHNQNPKPINFEQKATLKQEGRFEIKLDSLTAELYNSLYTYSDTKTGQNFLYFFNPNTYQIYFYDLKTNKLAFKVPLQKEGPNGVGNSIRGYQVKNLDSIFVYNYPVQMAIVNKIGEKIRSYKIFDYNEQGKLAKSGTFFPPVVDLEAFSPIYFKDTRLIMSGAGGGETDKENNQNRPFITILDVKTGKVSYGSSFTEAYQQANWGGGLLRKIYSTYNSKEDKMVYSFPIEHYLFSSRDGIHMEKHYAGSKFIDNISSLDKTKDYIIKHHDSSIIYKYYAERPSYSMIIYDSFREVYYRFAEFPVENFQKGNPPSKAIKKVSIILLDKNFQYLGETPMPHMVYRYKSFVVTSEGLCFWRVSENVEDKAVFDVFRIEKITQ